MEYLSKTSISSKNKVILIDGEVALVSDAYRGADGDDIVVTGER